MIPSIWPGMAGASGAVARAPQRPHHVTTWFTPRQPHANRPLPIGEILGDLSPLFNGARSLQRRGPWADGQTSHEKTTPAELWPDRSTSSPRRGGKRGGVGFPQKCGSTTDSAERLVGFTTNYNTPHPYYMGGTTYALQCSAMQLSSHPMTGHVVARVHATYHTTARRTHTPRVDQQAGTSGPIPIGSTGAAR